MRRHVVLALLLSGCGGKSDGELLTSAKAYLQKRDSKAAVIQLKNLLQANPSSAEARFLLGVARASNGLVRGVVGWVDFASPGAVAALSGLARDPLVKSVRPMLQDIPDPEWPDLPFNQLLRIAFKNRVVDSLDHPTLQRLRGEA